MRSFVLPTFLALAFAAAPAGAAGGVTVVVVDGKMTVTGDAADNDLEITSSALGSFTVTGMNGTTVNGASSFDASNVRRISVRTGDGADRVVCRGFTLRRDLRVRLEAGNDELVLDNVEVRGVLGVRAGSGNDTVRAHSTSHFARGARIRGSSGAEDVALNSSSFAGPLFVSAGRDNDQMTIFDSSFGNTASVAVFGLSGDDRLSLVDSDFDDDVNVRMGRNDDTVLLDDNNFDDDVDIDGDAGDDTLDEEGGNSYKRPPDFDSFEDVD